MYSVQVCLVNYLACSFVCPVSVSLFPDSIVSAQLSPTVWNPKVPDVGRIWAGTGLSTFVDHLRAMWLCSMDFFFLLSVP